MWECTCIWKSKFLLNASDKYLVNVSETFLQCKTAELQVGLVEIYVNPAAAVPNSHISPVPLPLVRCRYSTTLAFFTSDPHIFHEMHRQLTSLFDLMYCWRIELGSGTGLRHRLLMSMKRFCNVYLNGSYVHYFFGGYFQVVYITSPQLS